MRTAGALPQAMDTLANPACVIGPNQRCEHDLVDQELNRRLCAYESRVRGRFAAITDTLKVLSSFQHERDFVNGRRTWRGSAWAMNCLPACWRMPG